MKDLKSPNKDEVGHSSGAAQSGFNIMDDYNPGSTHDAPILAPTPPQQPTPPLQPTAAETIAAEKLRQDAEEKERKENEARLAETQRREDETQDSTKKKTVELTDLTEKRKKALTANSSTMANLKLGTHDEPEPDSLHKFLSWLAAPIGRFFAISYAALCGLGTTNKVANLLLNTGAGFAAGSATFLANAAMFWIMVPGMFLKMSSKIHSAYDETYELTYKSKSGNDIKVYKKLADKNGQHIQIRGPRSWAIFSFIWFFGTAASLVYTGLLLSGLQTTLAWAIPAVGTLSPLLFLPILVPFAIISLGSNWAFNIWDATEAFNRQDFWPKLQARIKRWFYLTPGHEDLDLKLTKQENVTYSQMLARKLIRLALFTIILTLGAMAIYSIGDLGIKAMFDAVQYLVNLSGNTGGFSMALFEAIAYPIILAMDVIAAGFFLTVATSRFTTLATRGIVSFANYYASLGNTLPSPAKILMHCTLVVPILIVAATATAKIGQYLAMNFLKAAGYTLNFDEAYLKLTCKNEFENYLSIKLSEESSYSFQSSRPATLSNEEHWKNFWANLSPFQKVWKAMTPLTLEQIHAVDYQKFKAKNPHMDVADFENSLSTREVLGSSFADCMGNMYWHPAKNGKEDLDIPVLAWNYLLRPIAATAVFFGRFLAYNIDLIALANAANNGALAHDGGHAGSLKNISSMVGNTASSGECYITSKVVKANVEDGDASTEQDAIPVNTLYFMHESAGVKSYTTYKNKVEGETVNAPEEGGFILEDKDGSIEADLRKRGVFAA